MECLCGCEETKQINQIYDEYGVIEYDLVCAECGAVIAHWAYGQYFYERDDF